MRFLQGSFLARPVQLARPAQRAIGLHGAARTENLQRAVRFAFRFAQVDDFGHTVDASPDS